MLLTAACSGSEDASATPDSTDGTVVGSAFDRPTALPTSTLPNWVQTRIEAGDLDGNGIEDDLQRYVANTGGGGVSHRSACEDSARLDTVWAEGTVLEVVASSTSECDGWTLVTDGETTSWVLNKYLDDSKPTLVTRGGGTGAATVSPDYVQVIRYMHWEIPVSLLRVAEVGETWCDSPSWQDPAGGDYVVKTLDGTPFVNPDPQNCGFGRVNDVVVAWVPAP